ncbi:hypothetical protein BGZ54_004516, partial [Gamsiella multidivaricata]
MDSSSSSPMRPVQADTTAAFPSQSHSQSSSAATPGPKKRKNAAVVPSLPKPKKQKLPRNLDSIPARNQLPNVPSTGGINKAGQRMVKGPYKKREKKDKDGKKVPGTPTATSAPGTPGAGPSATSTVGGRKGKAGKSNNGSTSSNLIPGSDPSSARADAIVPSGSTLAHGVKDEDGEDNERRPVTQTGEVGDANGGAEGGETGADGKDEDDDEHEEEPEYTEYEWNQEATSRGRSKEELKALLDRFSDEQLQRYEVYRRSVLSRSTVKKASQIALSEAQWLVGTILNQQVTQTMAFVVAGFCKVFVGQMVEK